MTAIGFRQLDQATAFAIQQQSGIRTEIGTDGRAKLKIQVPFSQVAGKVSADESIQVMYPHGTENPNTAVIKLFDNTETLQKYRFVPQAIVESIQRDPQQLMKAIYQAERGRNGPEDGGDRRYVLRFRVEGHDENDDSAKQTFEFRRTPSGYIHEIRMSTGIGKIIGDFGDIDELLKADPVLKPVAKNLERVGVREKIEASFFLPMARLIDACMDG